ncbi:MAG: tyrosine-type recombinase/integrase [Sphingobium sp.]|nr:tyrosine-type recombinase/integrase [Sphingobium sp.]
MLGHRARREQVSKVMSVPDLVALYQASPKYAKLAKSSQATYDIYLRQLSEALPTAPAGLIERRDVTMLLDRKGNRVAAANLLLAVIRALYAWARDRGHVANDPCLGLEPFDLGEHQPWPEWLIVEALGEDNARVRLAVHLLYYTAQRIGDVCGMRWSDIADGRITVTQEKTNKPLSIRLHEKLAAELGSASKRGLTILTRADGRRLNKITLRKDLQAWALEKGVKIVPHGLRKNAVIALLENDCSVAETAAISGQTLGMVEHYAKQRSQQKLGDAAILKWERNG